MSDWAEQNENLIKQIGLISYITFWGVILFGAAFPQVFLDLNFDFLSGKDVIELSKSYLFSLAMIIAIHLIDTSYIVFTNSDIEKEQLRLGLITNFISLALIAICLSFTVAITNQWGKIISFLIFWILLLITKYVSLSLTKPQIIKLNIPK